MFTVTYANHDNGCSDGKMVRDSQQAAERCAALMVACGYRSVTIVAA